MKQRQNLHPLRLPSVGSADWPTHCCGSKTVMRLLLLHLCLSACLLAAGAARQAHNGHPRGSHEPEQQRMDVKHKFTFTVNGKEFALEPPQLDSRPANNGSSPGEQAGARVSRIGESPDYDSGFEVDSYESKLLQPAANSSLSAPSMDQSGASNTQPAGRTARWHPPASSSSALMASPQRWQPQLRLQPLPDEGDNEDFSVAAKESGDASSNPDNNIISDWPKKNSARRAQQPASADRHSSAASLPATNRQASASSEPKLSTAAAAIAPTATSTTMSSRFSNLLSANNEHVGQSGEQRRPLRGWDAVAAPSASTKTASQPAKRANSTADHKTTPRAPVFARSRYTSSLAASVPTASIAPPASTASPVAAPTPSPAPYLSTGAPISKSSGAGASNQRRTGESGQAKAASGRLQTGARSRVPAEDESTHSVELIPVSSISERKSNYSEPTHTQSLRQTSGSSSSRQRKMVAAQAGAQDANLSADSTKLAARWVVRNESTPLPAAPKPDLTSQPREGGAGAAIALNQFRASNAHSGDHRLGIARAGHSYPSNFGHLNALIAHQHQQQQLQQQIQLQMLMHSRAASARAALAAQRPTQLESRRDAQSTRASLASAANQSGAEQMIATSNQLGVAHLGPQQQQLSSSESSSYNSIDYADRPMSGDASSVHADQPTSGDRDRDRDRDEHLMRGGSNSGAYASEGAEQGTGYEPSGSNPRATVLSASKSGGHNHDNSNNPNNQNGPPAGSFSEPPRVTLADLYKVRESAASASYPSLRGSIDPFEDLGAGGGGGGGGGVNGLSTSEYERDLADLDEEFNRHNFGRRPSAANPLMSDSYLDLSPERYEGRRYNRRPPSANYDYSSSADYLTSAGSLSSVLPRGYARANSIWASGHSPFASSSNDIWSDSGALDYAPMGSFSNPYASYRWPRARYQRLTPYGSSLLAASASEQSLQPAGFNFYPSGSLASALSTPTETLSISLSPLAAAAAAAASALAAADKSRHPGHWITIPRVASSLASAPATGTNPVTAAASASQQSSTLPAAYQTAAGAFQTGTGAYQTATGAYHTAPGTYYHRPPGAAYALSSYPLYAFAPRPAAAAALPLATSASGAQPAIIPYFATGGAPTFFAYRPTGLHLPTSSLLTAASFAYPLRLPIAPTPLASRPLSGLAPVASLQRGYQRPLYHSDLQFAETKSKSNLTQQQQPESLGVKHIGLVNKAGGLTAIARNFTRKMFGSASQIRAQHVDPPSAAYDLFTLSQHPVGLQLLSGTANSTGSAPASPLLSLASAESGSRSASR